MAHISDIVFPIKSIEMSIFGNEEVRNYSVAKKLPNGYDVPETIEKGEPVKNGPLDSHLGTTNMGKDCDTCGLDSEECPCHMAHVVLPRDVYNEGVMDYVKKILSCVCYECSKIPIDHDNQTLIKIIKYYYENKRLSAIKTLVSNIKKCPHCGAMLPIIKRDTKESGDIRLTKEYPVKTDKDDDIKNDDIKKKTNKEQIYGNEAFSKLQNISYDTTKILGFNPDSYVLSDLINRNFPISALSIRPSVKADYMSEGIAQDDLTKQTMSIIKHSNNIRKLSNNPNVKGDIEHNINNQVKLLQYEVAVYRNNNSGSLPKTQQKSSGKPTKSIFERISGKEGRLRHDLEGKRTNFCARSVISSDPNLSITEVGIPIKIAMILTIPIKVTASNIQELTKLVRNGRNIYPGANTVYQNKTFSNGKRLYIDLKYRKKDIKLHIGDIVERHLMNGDPVLFNRQPSLHRPSIMCHRAVVNPDKTLSTFRISVNVTKPYNADFDGDEMNLYVAQCVQTLLENIYLANVDKQIITPCFSTPIISFKQDTPAGLYLMTEKNHKMDWHNVMNIVMNLDGFDTSKIKKEMITSYKLISCLIPNMINYKDEKKNIEIVNGELLKGKINDKILTNILISLIWDRYGPKQTRMFIDNAQMMAEMYLLHKGLSIGYIDTIPSDKMYDSAKKEIHKKILESSHLLTEIENNPKLLDEDIFEKNMYALLQVVKPNIASAAFKMSDSSNIFHLLVDSGAKGSESNLGEITVGKGQEVLKYQRIGKTVNGRTLPHICFNDDTALSRGFITNSYNEGMNPLEYWFYHQGGREGLINTAVKTAETGYQQRRLIKALEAIMVAYDGSIRTSNNVILQLLYGDNQLDQTKQKKIEFTTMKMNNKQINDIHKFTSSEIKDIVSKNDIKELTNMNDEFCNDLINMRNHMRKNQLKVHLKYGEMKTSFFQAVNYQRIINDIINTNDADNKPLSPFYVMEQIEKILSHEQTVLVYYNNAVKNPIKAKNEKKFKFLFRYALYEYLSPKRCIYEYKFNKTKLDIVVREIVESFNQSIIHAGEMVGIVAAQSLGEPLTQMTLSSFHKSGSGVAGLQGTPRIRELLGYVKSITTPIMFIYIKPEFRNNKTLVSKIGASLKYTLVKDIASRINIVYDSENIFSSKDGMDSNSVFSINSSSSKINLKSMQWLFRIHLNREKMLMNDIEMLDIKTKFANFWDEVMLDNNNTKSITTKINNVCILTNYLNSDEPMIHVRVELNDIDEKTLSEFRNLLIYKFYIKGNEKITDIEEISEDTVITFDEKTGDVLTEKEFVIYTNGINYQKIREVSYIDQNRTICNDTKTIYDLYGIEATRAVLIKEITSVFTSEINSHHIAIACDLMTHTGDITSIDRFGITKLDTDLLSKATFEKTMDILTDAAVFNQTDRLRSVSSRIMLGKPIKGGTGLCDIMIDNEILENSEFGEISGDKKTNLNLTKMSLIHDIFTRKDTSNLFIPKID